MLNFVANTNSMKTVLKPSVTCTTSHIVYENVLLDRDFVGYVYNREVPVFLYFGTGHQIGQAVLHQKDDMLYATLKLNSGIAYNELYPHIPFDVRGRIQAVVLSSYACYDEAIPTLHMQATPGSPLKDVA